MSDSEMNPVEICESDLQTDRINSAIKKLAELKASIDRHKKHRFYWGCQIAALTSSIWIGETRFDELRKKEDYLKSAVSKAMESIDQKEPEVESLKVEKRREWTEKCDELQTRSTQYVNWLVGAGLEYSNENLTKSIETYRKEAEKVNAELETITEKLKDMESRNGFNSLMVLEDTSDASKVNTMLLGVKLSNGSQLQKIRSTEIALTGVEAEIRQKKITLEGLKRRKKRPTFLKPRVPL